MVEDRHDVVHLGILGNLGGILGAHGHGTCGGLLGGQAGQVGNLGRGGAGLLGGEDDVHDALLLVLELGKDVVGAEVLESAVGHFVGVGNRLVLAQGLDGAAHLVAVGGGVLGRAVGRFDLGVGHLPESIDLGNLGGGLEAHRFAAGGRGGAAATDAAAGGGGGHAHASGLLLIKGKVDDESRRRGGVGVGWAAHIVLLCTSAVFVWTERFGL